MNDNMSNENDENQIQESQEMVTPVNQTKEEKKKSFRNGLFVGMGSALLVVIATLIIMTVVRSVSLMKRYAANSATTTKQAESVVDSTVEEKMGILQDTIDQYFLEDVDTSTLEEGVYRGMLDCLDDPYSVYYTAEELNDLQQQTEGIYYGVGAYVSMDLTTGYAQFSKIIKDTPAEESGLLEGDYIVSVNGEDMQDKELSYVVGKIKGEAGTKVTLTLSREGTGQFDVDVERKKIESPTVNYEMYDNQIAYIQITEFDTVTEEQFHTAYQEAKAADMQGLILDLRSNPGGNLSTVVNIAREILPEGLIVYTEDKYGEKVEYSCDGKNQIQVPLVVLVNGYSASASEILSGAIKDYGIGTLMGTTTYGKGIVQKVIALSDGSAVKLTVSKYYTPNGNNIHKIGIEPDITVEFDADQYKEKNIDNQLEEAKKTIAEMLK